MGFDLFPAVIWLFKALPEEIRRSTLAKANAPKPGKQARDLFDINGKSPYLV